MFSCINSKTCEKIYVGLWANLLKLYIFQEFSFVWKGWCHSYRLYRQVMNIHHQCLRHDSSLWASFLGFADSRTSMGRGCQPHTQPPTWRTRPRYLWPLETAWPSYTPRHWVPILVVFYNTHELRWDCSYLWSLVTERYVSIPACKTKHTTSSYSKTGAACFKMCLHTGHMVNFWLVVSAWAGSIIPLSVSVLFPKDQQ
jgi:hypothetical protein